MESWMLLALASFAGLFIVLFLYVLLFHNKKKKPSPSIQSLNKKKEKESDILGVSATTIVPVKYKGIFISSNLKDRDTLELLNKFEVVFTEALTRNNPVLIRQFLSLQSYGKISKMIRHGAVAVVPLNVRDTHYELKKVNKSSGFTQFLRIVKCHSVKVEGNIDLPLGSDNQLVLEINLASLLKKSIYVEDIEHGGLRNV